MKIPHIDAPLDTLFRITGPSVRHDGLPLLGLPGSLFLQRRDILIAVPQAPLAALVADFDLHYAHGGIAALVLLRSTRFRLLRKMALVAHDRGRMCHRALCTLPWAEDEWCSSWVLQAELER